jgi:arylsulfatase
MLGNRGIYHKGWTAGAPHNPPGAGWPPRSLSDDVWELYDTRVDWAQARDLAHEHPDKLRDLQRLFLIEAARHNVLPLEERVGDLANPETAGRPVLARTRRQRLYRGIGRLNAFSVISIKNKSHRVTAEVHVPRPTATASSLRRAGFQGNGPST